MKQLSLILLALGLSTTAFAGGTTLICKDAQKNKVVEIMDVYSEGGSHYAETKGFTEDSGANNKMKNPLITFLYQEPIGSEKVQVSAFTVTAVTYDKVKTPFVHVLGTTGKVVKNDESSINVIFSGAIAQALADHSYVTKKDLTCELNIEKFP